MPIDNELTAKVYERYSWCRDNGHSDFVEKADKCDRFFEGKQWEQADLQKLKAVGRPALTINKIISTLSNVMGEQIFNRAETTYQPRGSSPSGVAAALTKVFKQIGDNNQLAWKRSDMFADGVIRSRGFLDMRVEFDDAMQGELRINLLNSKNVILDPDADSYDPDEWSEVFITKWVTVDDIAVLYGKDEADLLKGRHGSTFPYGYDSIDTFRDRIGSRQDPIYYGQSDFPGVVRSVRLIERQYRQLDKQKHFVVRETGDMRPIPKEFDRDRIAFYVEKLGLAVTEKLVRRLRWTTIADNVRLHDDWMPYKHFTVVPYFPYFRHGTTIGLVENLLGSQELLNKTSSQELHIVNTTANSGWKVKSGSLTNMTPEELQERGAETGLVLEVNGDVDKDIQKIQPNTVPQGLDRISYKAEEHIKTISGVNDSMQGFDREDVAARAIEKKKQSGQTGLAKPMDSLARTDFIIARNALDCIQQFYTEARMLTITKDPATGETETLGINQPTPEGAIANDLTLGEYGVIITSVPARETLEDSQFEQAVALRELGIQVPDEWIVRASRLMDKTELIRAMQERAQSPEARAQAEAAARAQAAEIAKLESEAASKGADAGLKRAKAEKTVVETQVLANTPIETPDGADPELELAQAEHEAGLAERAQAHKERMDFMNFGLKKEIEGAKLNMQAAEIAGRRQDAREQSRATAAAAASRPTTQKG